MKKTLIALAAVAAVGGASAQVSVLMENLSRRDGAAIVEIGYYDPLKKVINFDKAALHKYINCGAYPTDTVRHLVYKMLAETKN